MITYQELQKEIRSLSERHLITLDFDEIEEDPAKEEIEEFKTELKAIVDSILTVQIVKRPIAGKTYKIPDDTQIEKGSLFSIYTEVNSLMKQNILIQLLWSITIEFEHEVIHSFIEAYEMYGNDEIKILIKETKLKNKLGDMLATHEIISHIEHGDDLYIAIKKTLISRWLDPEDIKNKQKAGYGFQIKDFVWEFNTLILWKIGINPHLMISSTTEIH